jgi:beta-lactamase regulating signal transducer with metallopeptidase domain
MNDLPIALVWLAVQVTAVTLTGLGLTVFAGRRAPGAGGRVALTALAATLVLGLLACCPLPSWWAWDSLTALPTAAPAADNPMGSQGESSEAPLAHSSAASGGGAMSLSRLLQAVSGLQEASTAPAQAGRLPRWQTVVAGLAGIATAIGILRFLLGLWAIRHSWHQSKRVHDPALLRLVEELRTALGVKRPVAVRESAELTTAATVGWRKPTLLLPIGWYDWTEHQRRVVVAHELAHVARGDFAAWLLARLAVAVYCWHPLVRALAGRLRLQQELAADDSAAPLAGGRPAYLRALAELALRADGLAHGWPAPAFLSAKNTLLRRVDMLRVMDDGARRPTSRIGRRLTIALVMVVALTVSALRGPVRQTWAAAPGPTVASAPVEPFDLSLLAPGGHDADGVFGVRPAALLNRPGTERLRQRMNAWIDLLTGNTDDDAVGIHVEDVEQLMGRVYIKGENKVGKRALLMSLNVLRTTKDIDWARLGEQCGLKGKKHHYKGETYVAAAFPEFLAGITGPEGKAYLWAPDRRTLILDDEKAIKQLIAAKASGNMPVPPEFAVGWDTMSRGLFAVAIDNREGRLLERTMTKAELKEALSDPKKPEYHLARFYQKASTMVAGFAGNDDFHFDLHASADDGRLAIHCKRALAAAKKAAADPPEDADAVAMDFLRMALDRTVINREGEVVTVHSDVPAGFDALLKHLLTEMSREKKGERSGR